MKILLNKKTEYLKLIILFILAAGSFAAAQNTYYRMARILETGEVGISGASGLAFSGEAEVFLVVTAPGASEIIMLDGFGRLAGSFRLGTPVASPLNMVFDSRANSLLFLDPEANELVEIGMETGGGLKPLPGAITRYRIPQFDLKNAAGMAFDPQTGELFILDGQGSRVIRITPDPRLRFGGSPAEQNGRISTIPLSSLPEAELQGIAFDPSNGHLYVMVAAGQKLYELTGQGEIVTTRDLSSLHFGDTQGMVFAPSGDPTDDPAIQSLYFIDRALNSGQGDIVELSLIKPKQIDLSMFTEEGELVQIILTSEWSPPSPDPSGAAYIPSSNTLFVSDGEVEEMPLYDGANVYETSLSGELVNANNTLGFSDEPTGVAYNPNNHHLFFSDDTGDRWVWELNPGPDGQYWTSDDIVTSFVTLDYGSNDPEGITYNTLTGHLFIVDGEGSEVYEVNPGANGVFDGVPSSGDDIVTHFDTAVLGVIDPEGVEFNPDNGHLYLIGTSGNSILEITTSGTAVRAIDVSGEDPHNPAGLAYAPRSNSPFEKSLYLLTRGADNNNDPNENDGKIYEFSLGTFTPSLGIDDVTVTEGNAGTVNAVFTVTLTATSPQTVTVDFATEDGTATTANNDYVAVSGQLTFLSGVTSQQIIVEVNGDVFDEPDETFHVNLSNAVNAPIGDGQGIGTISNDDGATLVTVSFQDGVNGYNGTRDTQLLSGTPTINYGSATSLNVDGSPDETALFYWDLSSLSPGIEIQSVDIILNVTNNSGNTYDLYELKRPWVENQATWNQYATGQNWQTAGASGSQDRGNTVIGGISAPSTGPRTVSLNAAGVAVVQSWVDNPSSNHGIIIQNYLNNNGLGLSSRETGTASQRPKLTVTYTSGASSIVVNAKVYLEGAWDNGAMRTSLKDSDVLPLNQPFNSAPWNYNGAEIVGEIPAGVVDWVLIKLRTSPAASDEVMGRAAFIKSDGAIVDLDGESPVSFSGIAAWNYYIVIYHRNHLALMSSAVQALNESSSLYNFTTAQAQAYGTNPMKELSPGVFAMFAGDGNSDGSVNETDRIQSWRLQNGASWEYLHLADYNLDGGIDAQDLNFLWRGNNGLSTQVP